MDKPAPGRTTNLTPNQRGTLFSPASALQTQIWDPKLPGWSDLPEGWSGHTVHTPV